MKARTQSRKMLGALVLCMLTFACQQDMARQPRYRPLQYSEVFADHRSARPLVEHTVAREHLRDDAHLYTGKEGEEYVTTFPFEITESVLERGFTRPPSYHTELARGFKNRGTELPLRDAPVGYYFDVITNGFGAMPDYAQQVSPEDRWAIIAYIRVLQLSRNAKLSDLPEDEQKRVREQLGRQP
ncbi:MAG TPA: cytochrome c [Pirellulaceae bacterium]|nr:cytochrome c [Pirellulaceae bacterium]